MTVSIDPLCGVPSHRMGRWEDVVLGIWWCPDCGEEIWATEGAGGDAEAIRVRPAPGGAEGPGGVGRALGVPRLLRGPLDRGDAAGAPRDRAPGGLWALIAGRYGGLR